ncbi:MAG: pantetheine-phosphate adenylyltransferase [Acidobacteria bacterium]|jgi:pantetheine-phosphate adenylyltransferase|nr:pantetheine-phosphate adenylyltransferase [Acidobacteriota bacterium]
MKRIAVYPGSFDPVTNGHLDIVGRGASLFDELVVAVLQNTDKQAAWFSVDERQSMLKDVLSIYKNVRVDRFDGLLVDYVRSVGGCAIVRGLRAVSDFEYEFQMALMNRHLCEDVETLFLMPAEAYTYLSSRLVREVAQLGGSVSGLVPPQVEELLVERVGRNQPRKGNR